MTEEQVSYSPSVDHDTETTMSFPAAMAAVILGKIISKKEWDNMSSYCMLRDGWLMIHKDEKWHRWTINDGDLLGGDWFAID